MFKNEASYSPSRASTLVACPRRYYYGVYRMWGGWKSRYGAPAPEAAEAYTAKFAMSLAEWAGKLVHGLAEWACVQARRKPTFLDDSGGLPGLRLRLGERAAKAIRVGLSEAEGDFAADPKRRVQLIAMNRGWDVRVDELESRVSSRLDALCSPGEAWSTGKNLMESALSHPRSIESVERLIEWELAGVKIFMKADLILSGSDGVCRVVDWKTGRQKPQDRDQVAMYSAWAIDNGWTGAKAALVYLDGGGHVHVDVVDPPPDPRREAEERVGRFADDLAARLVGRSLDRNEPIERLFESTTDARLCWNCPFYDVCGKDGTRPGSTVVEEDPLDDSLTPEV